MKKIALYSLVGLFALSCSVSQPNNSLNVRENYNVLAQKYDFAKLEKEYKPFSTKALSNGYVQRMFNKFLVTTPNPVQVIRQLEFARYLKDVKSDLSYFTSLNTVITNDPTIYTKINGMTEVGSYKTANPATFGVFIDNLSPVPINHGVVTTIAGSGVVGSGGNGENASSTSVQFNQPWGVAKDSDGNIYISDIMTNKIRKISASDGKIYAFAGNGSTTASGDGGPALSAQLNPYGIAVYGNGSNAIVYAADGDNGRIRKIDVSTGLISTLASGFTYPVGIAVNSSGNVYVGSNDNKIFEISPGGTVSLLAGGGVSSQDGPATSAQLTSPYAIAFDTDGNVYVADSGNGRIVKISNGNISTVASGFSNPRGIAVYGNGTNRIIYVSDTNNCRIMKITSGGTVSLLSGDGTTNYKDATGAAAQFYYPIGLAVDSSNTLYVADRNNHRIRKIE